jgi:hypothetical protein
MNNRKLLVVGDTHGERINDFFTPNADILHVGDYGMGFSTELNERLGSKLNTTLELTNTSLWVNRGNHDDPYFWKTPEAANQFSRVKFVPSYTVLDIGDQAVLFLGGALSVDRQARKRGIDYWADEGFDFNLEKLRAVPGLERVTMVVSHTAPAFCPPVDFNGFVEQFFVRDLHLKGELIKERSAMTETFFAVKNKCPLLKRWFFGHFHPRKTWTETLHGVDFTCLAINDFAEI